jgi:hypothetical protein
VAELERICNCGTLASEFLNFFLSRNFANPRQQ